MSVTNKWMRKRGHEYDPVGLSEATTEQLTSGLEVEGLRVGYDDTIQFRGHRYDDVVRGLSGYTLYDDFLNPGRVRQIAERLKRTSYLHASKHMRRWRLSKEEYAGLATLFAIMAGEGAGLRGEW